MEVLSMRHLQIMASVKEAENSKWLQIMLFKSLLANAERNLSGLIPIKNPYCIVALKNNKIISVLTIVPYNRRGTCCSISLDHLNSKDELSNRKQINHLLFKKAIEQEERRANSWIFSCAVSSLDEISLARELGFQPLKINKCWNLNTFINNEENPDDNQFINSEYEVQALNNRNKETLWPLYNSSISINLRRILDRDSKDIIDLKHEFSNIVVSRIDRQKPIAIAAILKQPTGNNILTFDFFRYLAWDSRLESAIPLLLSKLNINNQTVSLETNSEDNRISEILLKKGWIEKNEKILFGRSIWKRQSSKALLGTKSLEEIFSRLQPQGPALPTPSLKREN